MNVEFLRMNIIKELHSPNELLPHGVLHQYVKNEIWSTPYGKHIIAIWIINEWNTP